MACSLAYRDIYRLRHEVSRHGTRFPGCILIADFSSVKWVGFFAMATVGLYTIEDLWEKFGDLKMPPVRERAVGLISSCLTSLDYLYKTLDCPSAMSHSAPTDCLPYQLQNSLLDLEPIRTW